MIQLRPPAPTVGDVLPLLASPEQRAILARHARAARLEERLLLGGASLLLGLGVAALVTVLGGLL